MSKLLRSVTAKAFKEGAETAIPALAGAASKIVKSNGTDLLIGSGKSGSDALLSRSVSKNAADNLTKVLKEAKGSGDNFLDDLIEKGEFASKTDIPPPNALNDLADSITKNAKEAGKQIDKTTALTKARAAMSIKNIILLSGFAYGAYMVIDPMVSLGEKNGAKLTINDINGIVDVSQSSGNKPGDVVISYTPNIALYDGSLASNTTGDSLMISGTDCTPNINGRSYPVTQIISSTSCVINIKSAMTSTTALLKVNKQGGTATVETDLTNQTSLASIGAGDYLGSLAGGAVNTAGNIGSSVVAQGSQNALELLKSVLGPFWPYIKIALIIIGCIIGLIVFFKISESFNKKTMFGRSRRK